jgi:MFS family permease
LGVAFQPYLLRERDAPVVLPTAIALLAVSAAMHNFAIPFWFSWMADLIPKRVLNRVWGWRQRAMHLSWTAANLLVTVLLYYVRWPATVTFPVLTVLAVAAGLTDVLLFLGVVEPPNLIRRDARPLHDLVAPMRHPDFRRFVFFTCAWSFATACASSFMMLYVLKVLGVSMWETSLMWCVQGLGTALASGFWGRIADRHGQRPVIRLCVVLKPVIVIVFCLLTPANVRWLLPLVFFPDGMLNSGYTIATNGYMLSLAPRENRSAFIAAITGLSGVCGGVSTMVAGAVLGVTAGWSVDLFGRTLNHYHLLFAASLAMRVVCIRLARIIREPGSSRSIELVNAVLDDWSSLVPRFPVGLYRRR